MLDISSKGGGVSGKQGLLKSESLDMLEEMRLRGQSREPWVRDLLVGLSDDARNGLEKKGKGC